jgi:hypothetical protein
MKEARLRAGLPLGDDAVVVLPLGQDDDQDDDDQQRAEADVHE